MKNAIILAALVLSGCASLPQSAARTEGDLIIAEMTAQQALNAAKPSLSPAKVTAGQAALDAWLAALVKADTARKALDTAAENAALTQAASAQATALTIIPKP